MGGVINSASDDEGFEIGPPIGDDQKEVWELLSALKALRTTLWIKQEDHPAPGLSIVLSVNQQRGYFLLDAVRDSPELKTEVPLTIETQVEGRYLEFRCTHTENVPFENGPAYRATSPEILVDRQRRSDYRVKIPLTDRHQAVLHEPDRAVRGRLVDLSRTGCAARTDSAPQVHVGEQVRIQIRLGGSDINCPAVIRNVKRVAGFTRVGMEFDIENNLPEAQQIDQAVAGLQRSQLRSRKR